MGHQQSVTGQVWTRVTKEAAARFEGKKHVPDCRGSSAQKYIACLSFVFFSFSECVVFKPTRFECFVRLSAKLLLYSSRSVFGRTMQLLK